MDYDLFSNLFKYRESEKNSPLENYLTELFAYILRILLSKKNHTAITLLNDYFNINCSDSNFENITIETQCEYWIEKYKRYARPDLKISIDNERVYFIENKVDSDLNQYKDIDQIQLYEAIDLKSPEKNMGVRTLTKYEISTKSKLFNTEKNKVFWRQTYELLKKSDFEKDILIQNYLNFLEEYNMGERKILKITEKGLDEFYSLYGFLSDNLLNIFLLNGYTKNAVNFFGDQNYFGFSIKYDKKNCIWIGLYRDEADIIVESFVDDVEKLKKRLDKKKIKYSIKGESPYGNPIFAKISISELQKGTTYEEQEKIFKSWITDNAVVEIANESYEINKEN
ncbi:MAG: hypothetical protein IKZ86_10110 [Spirochaetaceae bacterium]|nr:hypothetical protein [Spirochaetaceae bacterium]